MGKFKFLFGFVPGVTLGMWLRGVWFCIALCMMCGVSDDTPLPVIAGIIANVAVAGLVVAGDREKWGKVSN